MKQNNRLAVLLGMGGLNGTVALAALSGLFTIENALTNAVLFMAGPGAILTAALSEGAVRERMLAAVLAGTVATIIVVFAAGFGPKLLGMLNVPVIKMAGGLAIGVIALIIMDVKVPEWVPLLMMVAGIIAGIVWR
jgi:hypothetical protein